MAEHAHITPAPRVTPLGRRTLFAGTATLLAASAVASPVASDTALIAACNEFIGACQALEVACDAARSDVEANAVCDVWTRATAGPLDRMAALHARTPAGIQARALALHHANPDQFASFDDEGTMIGGLLAFLLRDAAALGGAA